MEAEEKGGFSKQAEAAVYRSAQAGCPESLDRLLRQHEGLVRQIAAQQQLCGLPIEEALQAGRIGLRQPGHSQALRSLLGWHSQGEYEWVERVTQAYLRRRGGHHEQG